MSAITKIVIEIGDMEFALTTEQAEELYGILDKIFGKRETFRPLPDIITDPYKPWRYWEPKVYKTEITCRTIPDARYIRKS